MSSQEEPPSEPSQTAIEVRTKARSAIALVAGRNVAIKLVALLGSVVFARLLSPSSFGTVAFGLTLLLFMQLLSDGGLGAGLIRRPQEPHLEDLRVLLGYQLILTIALAVLVGFAGVVGPFGRPGLVTAIMMPALPLLAFRTPSSIVFERNLNYAPLVRVEILEEATYYTWGVVTIILGGGIWGLATASIVKALVGTSVLLSSSPVARLAPSFSWQRLKPMLEFGIKFQAVGLTNIAGLQLLNLGVASIGGLAMLGLWALAWRILQIPFLLFSALWRVSYPAAAQLLSAGESARNMVERGLRLAAVATGAILVPATGAISPLIPAVFGQRWAPVADVLPPIFFALQVSGPVSVSTAGYLYAVGETSTVLRATAATSVVWLIVTLPLIPYLGLTAVGIGGMVSAFVEIPLLAGPVRRQTHAAFLGPTLVPWIFASLGGAAGWYVSRAVSHGFVAAFLGGSVAICIYGVPIVLLRRDAVFSIARLALRATRRH